MKIGEIRPYFLIYKGDEELTEDLENYKLEISDNLYNGDKKEIGERMMFCEIEKVEKSDYIFKLTKKTKFRNNSTFNKFCEEVEESKPSELEMFPCRRNATADLFLSSSDLSKLKENIETRKYNPDNFWKNIIVICPIALCCVSGNEFATIPAFLGSTSELNPTPLILDYNYDISDSKDFNAFEIKISSFFHEHKHKGTIKFRHRICNFRELVDKYIDALKELVDKHRLREVLMEMKKVNTLNAGEPYDKKR